jgi:phage baseplate assembly protein W
MATFSFKSVGKTQDQRLAEVLQKSPVPIGLKTPLQPGGKDGAFALHYNLAEAIHDNLRNLLLTNKGERLGLHDFGADLRPLVAEYSNQESFDSVAIERIKTAVGRWLPFVELNEYAAEELSSAGKTLIPEAVRLIVSYSVPALGVKQRALQLTLRVN